MRTRSTRKELWIGVRITLVFAALTGIVYPFAITGVSQVAFNDQANGGLIKNANGDVIGARLIGQSFMKQGKDQQGNVTFSIDPKYFQGRLSYTLDPSTGAPSPYNAANSVGSNYGPSNPLLLKATQAAVKAYRDQGIRDDIPIDLVTSDFTGFDPDISEASALIQVSMVAQARGLDVAKLRALVEQHVDGRILFVFGQPHVNVLMLNMALDSQASSLH
jgi:K+-transporting ATPase ATPase C chain